MQKRVQTSFTVKLTGYDEKQKIPLIKEIKNQLPDTNLVQVLSLLVKYSCFNQVLYY